MTRLVTRLVTRLWGRATNHPRCSAVFPDRAGGAPVPVAGVLVPVPAVTVGVPPAAL